jgi:hypothetical protein
MLIADFLAVYTPEESKSSLDRPAHPLTPKKVVPQTQSVITRSQILDNGHERHQRIRRPSLIQSSLFSFSSSASSPPRGSQSRASSMINTSYCQRLVAGLPISPSLFHLAACLPYPSTPMVPDTLATQPCKLLSRLGRRVPATTVSEDTPSQVSGFEPNRQPCPLQ